MQQKDEKTLYFAKIVGQTIRDSRLKIKTKNTINKIAHEYDLDVGNTSRVENGLVDVKFVTLWKIAESLGISPVNLILEIKKNLPENFSFIDE